MSDGNVFRQESICQSYLILLGWTLGAGFYVQPAPRHQFHLTTNLAAALLVLCTPFGIVLIRPRLRLVRMAVALGGLFLLFAYRVRCPGAALSGAGAGPAGLIVMALIGISTYALSQAFCVLIDWLMAPPSAGQRGLAKSLLMSLPRSHRGDVEWDLRDDVTEMRCAGFGEVRVKCYWIWHFAGAFWRLHSAGVLKLLGTAALLDKIHHL